MNTVLFPVIVFQESQHLKYLITKIYVCKIQTV